MLWCVVKPFYIHAPLAQKLVFLQLLTLLEADRLQVSPSLDIPDFMYFQVYAHIQ